MAVQNRRHNNRAFGHEVKDTVLERSRIYAANVTEPNRMQKSGRRKRIELVANFGQEPGVEAGLTARIAFGAIGNVRLNERMKIERQHFRGPG